MKTLTLILYLFLFQSIYLLKIEEEEGLEDLVDSIPEYSYNGTIYSGYLNVSDVKKFHYLFIPAYEEPEKKPLVLWLNGGPGCSSLDGWANEHGPMLLDDKDGKFKINEYSWNKAANMIYLESPGGVGFSYIDSQKEEDLKIDDKIAAEDNLQALLSFFTKFPSQKTKDFYISGESYGGIYVPILAYNVIQYNKNLSNQDEKINLKGILVGNGVADWNYDTTFATMDFIFTHHLVSYEDRLDYVKYCLKNETYNETKCKEVVDLLDKTISGINIYDYLRECKTPHNLKGEIYTKSKYYQYVPWFFKNKKKTDIKETLFTENDDEEQSESVPCFDDTIIENYFNREDVQNAIHVTPKNTWYVCSGPVYNRYKMLDEGSIWAYPTLINENIRILIYSGDSDVIVPYNGNQAWIKNLNLDIEEKWRSWRAYNDIKNIAGYIVKYKGLTFCTIKGVGHMAPGWKPKESFYMFEKFIKDEKF